MIFQPFYWIDNKLDILQAIANWGSVDEKKRLCAFRNKQEVIDFIHSIGVKDVRLTTGKNDKNNFISYTYECVNPLGSPFIIVVKSKSNPRKDLKVMLYYHE